MKVATKMCAAFKGQDTRKTTLSCNEQIAKIVKEKRLLYKEWQKNRSDIFKKLYVAKKKAKRVVAAAKKEKKRIYETR